tara:strand:- start:642 stop:1196 length:555 start_codon:yes stop_codon:yes gene_type:complete
MESETKNETKGDPFWLEVPTILLEKDRLLEFYPVKEMSFKEKLNAITRLSIYLGVLLSVFKLNLLYMYIPIVFFILTFLFFRYTMKTYETFKKQDVKTPTPHNPFMNSLPGETPELSSEVTNNISDENQSLIDNNIREAFNLNLYQNLDDIFGKENSFRQFFTMPISDQTSFAKWLYGDLTSKP